MSSPVPRRRLNVGHLLSAREPTVGGTKVVAVDGHGGAGKSTLAKLLSRHLDAEVVHTDDFASWDNPKDWWPLLIEWVLEPIASGATTLSYPRSRWWPEHRPEPVRGQPVTAVMVLEGVGALRREFRPYLTLGIFVETPREVCLERGVERDAAQGSPGAIRAQWEKWLRDEGYYLQRDQPEGYADLVVDGTRPFEEEMAL